MALVLDYLEKKNWRIKEYKFWLKFFIDMIFLAVFILILLTVREAMQEIYRQHDALNIPINYSMIDEAQNLSLAMICVCTNQVYDLNTLKMRKYNAYEETANVSYNAFEK
jgi:hypothetical protein